MLRDSNGAGKGRDFPLESAAMPGEPAHYGLGKSGWVTAVLPLAAEPPLDVLEAWISESHHVIALKSLQPGSSPGRFTNCAGRRSEGEREIIAGLGPTPLHVATVC